MEQLINVNNNEIRLDWRDEEDGELGAIYCVVYDNLIKTNGYPLLYITPSVSLKNGLCLQLKVKLHFGNTKLNRYETIAETTNVTADGVIELQDKAVKYIEYTYADIKKKN